jgi:starch-binding outer membrane protein, SusD/RagB family
MKFNLNIYIVYFFLFIWSIISCKKFVEIGPPKDKLESSTVFENNATANSAVAGIYSGMLDASPNAIGVVISSASDLSADEVINYSQEISNLEFFRNNLLPDNETVSAIWKGLYSHIVAANKIIEGLALSSGVSEDYKKQLTGEAYFIRAFNHFYLVNLFGDVPVVTTSEYAKNALVIRMPRAEVYNQIIADLIAAQLLLPEDYSFSANERIRPNKWAATALLARVYLFNQDWINAEKEATTLINNQTLFSLTEELNDVFLANSTEAIWQLKPIGNGYTREAETFIIYTHPNLGVGGSFAFNTRFLNAFETNDNRKTSWIGSVDVEGETFYFPFKYKIVSGTPLTEYSTVLRLAEQYLIRAESRARQENINGAQQDINSIRHRAGLANTTASTQSALTTEIMHERQVELFTEGGHRWLDIKRSENRNDIMQEAATIKGTIWKPSAVLFPIPKEQIINDPNMRDSQNEGY